MIGLPPRAFAPAWLAAVLACGSGAPDRAPAAERPDADPARDAEILGREVLELTDRTVDYRGSHGGRVPRNIAALGVDSLTPETLRQLAAVPGGFNVTVSFRRPGGRAVRSCRGGVRTLEDATLHGGRVKLACTLESGEEDSVEIGSAER